MEKQLLFCALKNKKRNGCIKMQMLGLLHIRQDKLTHKIKLQIQYKKI